MKKKIGVVLSGCGVFDGSEIHESVLTLLSIDRGGAESVCIAPNVNQMHIINHLTGEEVKGETRNVLVEAARIARGKINDISKVKGDDIDALFFPGGFGVVKNLCDFIVKGENCEINPQVARLVKEIIKMKKPLAAVCISPVLIAKIYEGEKLHPILSIGTDKDMSSKLRKMGSNTQECSVKEVIVDSENKIVTSPAYVVASSISETADSIEKTVTALIDLILKVR